MYFNTIVTALGLLIAGQDVFAQLPASEVLSKNVTIDTQGAIVRGDLSKKEIALVLTGDEFADGGEVIRVVLHHKNVPASFFLTGNFYANPAFKSLIHGLKKDGHYLGPHSDKHLL